MLFEKNKSQKRTVEEEEKVTIPLVRKGLREEVDSKEFNEIYMMDLSVRAHNGGSGDTLYIEYVPYDQATQDRLLNDKREVRLDFWTLVASVPEAAFAFKAVADAIPAIIAYQDLINTPPVVDKPTEEDPITEE